MEGRKIARKHPGNCKTIVFSGSGTSGDLYPLIGLALELSQRGFLIRFLTNEFHRDLVEDYGFGFLNSGTRQQHMDFHNDARIWNPALDAAEIGFDGFIRPAIRASYDHIVEQHKAGRNVAVVSTYPLLNGAAMAAIVLAIPHVTVTLSPRYIQSHIAPPAPLGWMLPTWIPLRVRRLAFKTIASTAARRLQRKEYFLHLNQIRQSYGLDPITAFNMQEVYLKSHLHLAMFPSWFGMPAPDWPSNLHIIGFPQFNQMRLGARMVVDDFIDRHGSPIVFTSGTGIMDSSSLFYEAKEICELLGLPGLFIGKVSGYSNCADARFLQVDYIDFRYVLPKSRIIVHHGGIGTLAEAVRARIPQLIRPLAFDQYDNADRVHRLGLGTFVLPKHFRAIGVARIIRALLDYRETTDLIDSFASRVTNDQALRRACDLIVSYFSSYKEQRTVL